MEKFEFKDATIQIEINGKVYSFNPESVEYNDAVLSAANKVASIDKDKANQATMKMLSDELRNTVGAMLGKDAQEEIFAGREQNIVQELRLLNALIRAREEAGVDSEIESLLATFGGRTIDG